MRLSTLALPLLLSIAAPAAHATMVTRNVEWTLDGKPYQGVLVYDDKGDADRPGVVLVPNWKGVNASAVERAKQVAGDDYVVLVADVYGRDVRPKSDTEAAPVAKALRDDRPELRKRALEAVNVLKAQAGKAPLDTSRIGAIGFCFGGTTVLELVRAGTGLSAAISLHGGLGTPMPAAKGSAKAPLLVLNGAADKSVSAADIQALGAEMDAAGADWQFVNFSGAYHCFAEPEANNPPGCAYDARAAKRAYAMVEDFFEASFKE